MKLYKVNYYTEPSPGLAFYSGKITVSATDDKEARKLAAAKLARQMQMSASRFVVTSVSQDG